ncbi:agamous-like MADS-box protein AGL61 [Andrographis paniculata]|uniref:agamous-like MADS-box protein AGL61 n=1 Tax=Andrographis paniculata TaxID=175694 RepID=UPI0021E8815C|nr:agamous-like MADS-box protein AGL61 [Andrographis paniculata]
MAGRQTRGRQRIPMKRIQNMDDLYATFSKRRQGLYKKASELSTQCGVDIGVIISSPTGHPYSFFHPRIKSVLSRYRNLTRRADFFAEVSEAHSRERIYQFNRDLNEALTTKEELKDKDKLLDEVYRTRVKGWWEQIPIDNLNGNEVSKWITWFENLIVQVSNRKKEIGNCKNTTEQQQNASITYIPDFPNMHVDDPVPANPNSPNMPTGGSNVIPIQGRDFSSVGEGSERQATDHCAVSRPRFEQDPIPRSEDLDFSSSSFYSLLGSYLGPDWPNEDGNNDDVFFGGSFGSSSQHPGNDNDNGDENGGSDEQGRT